MQSIYPARSVVCVSRMQLRKIALWSPRPSRMINMLTMTETSHSKSGDFPLSLRLTLEILLRQGGVMTIDDSAAAAFSLFGPYRGNYACTTK